MGRRIYDDSGRFVWKYVFGRQSSNMCLYAEEYGIGDYVSEVVKDGSDEWTEHRWMIPYDPDVSSNEAVIGELKSALFIMCKGYSLDDLYAKGMKAVWEFVEAQSDDWKEHYKSDLEVLRKAKSHMDFEYYSTHGDYSFNLYDVYARRIEEDVHCDFDFVSMTAAFISHLESFDDVEFFVDEL